MQAGHIEGTIGAVRIGDANGGACVITFCFCRRCGRGGIGFGGAALLSPLLTVNDIRTGYFLFATAHQCQLDLVLNVFNMHSAPRGHAALKNVTDLGI